MAITDTIPRAPQTIFMIFGLTKGAYAVLTEELVKEVPGVWCKLKTSQWDGKDWLLCGAPHHAVRWLQKSLERRKIKAKEKPPEQDATRLPTAVPVGQDPPFWREQFKLLPYQAEGVAFAATRAGSFFLWPAGAGKSPGAINWALHDVGDDGKGEGASTLIVGIAPTVVQWARELAKFTTADIFIFGENVAVPDPGRAVYTSGALLLAPPAAEDRAKRPVVATPCTAAGLGKRLKAGEQVRVVWKIDKEGMHWRTLVAAEFCHLAAAEPGADGMLSTVAAVRGDGLPPGWILTFADTDAVTPLPRFCVIGWEMMREYNDMLCALGFTSLIVDEAQRGSARRRRVAVPLDHPDEDGKTVEFKKLRNLTASIRELAGRIPRRLICTATPIMDLPRELWAQWDICEPWQPGSYKNFAIRYCNARPGAFGGIDDHGTSNMEELRERLSSILHQVSAKVARAQLPPMRRTVFYLPVSEQCEPVGDFRAAYKAAADAGYGADREVRLMEAASKKRKYVTGRVVEVLRNNPEAKILVFTGRRKDCEVLGDAVRKEVLKAELNEVQVFCAHGGASQIERQAAVDAYRAAKSAVLVGTGDAFGTGIDGMQCTDLQLHAMLPVSPGQVMQREGRAIRVGQDRPVLVEYVIAEGTEDERCAELLINKLPAVETVVKNQEIEGLSMELAYGDATGEQVKASLVDTILFNDFVDEED